MKRYKIVINGYLVWDFNNKKEAYQLKENLEAAAVKNVKIDEVECDTLQIKIPHRDRWEYPQSEVKNG